MGFFQDLKQDLSQTVNDLGIKNEADELNLEEESTTTASEDLFGSASDTDFGDLESMLEKEVAALEETQGGAPLPSEEPVETDTTSDIDLEALLSDIETAEKDGTVTEIEEEIQADATTQDPFMKSEEQTEPESVLDGFSFDDLKPIEEDTPAEEPSASEELPSLEEVAAEEAAPIDETPVQETPIEEVSAVSEELPPVEEILIPEELPEEAPTTDDNMDIEISTKENNNSEADEDMEQLLNEVEQNIQEHTYMDEAPVAAQEDNGDINVAVSTDTAVITAGMNITGDVTSSGNMDLIGNITGNIEILGKLNVTGSITGNSAAAEVYAESAQINGEINSKGSVKIGQSSVVIGNIFAKSAVIAGAVKGDIDVHGPVILDTSAIVMGNIKSKSVQINNGAVIEGMCSQCYADISPTSFFNDVKKNRK